MVKKIHTITHLKPVLDRLYHEYDFKARVPHDPISFPHRYKSPEDIEAAGFIASCFAYGKVELFKPVIESILSPMGQSPYDFLLHFDLSRGRKHLSGLKYRFSTSSDIIGLLYALSKVLKRYKRLESLFYAYDTRGDATIEHGLVGLVNTFLTLDTSPVYGENIKTHGFLHFFPSPERGSACKRMNMFLRWMVRDRDIDFGLWKGVQKQRLVIPLDTHIARISKCLGFTKRTSQDWKMAVEITGSLKQLDPDDPIKYDFALCHQGISKACNKMRCKECGLKQQGQ